MSKTVKSEEVEVLGRPEFDIIIGGKQTKRVSSGILIENTPEGNSLHICCNRMELFQALWSLKDAIRRYGLMEDYEAFEKMVQSDPKDLIGELINKLTELMGELD